MNEGLAAKKVAIIYYINFGAMIIRYTKSVPTEQRKAKLNEDYFRYINMEDEWIYYPNKSDDEKIYKMRTNDSELQIVN